MEPTRARAFSSGFDERSEAIELADRYIRVRAQIAAEDGERLASVLEMPGVLGAHEESSEPATGLMTVSVYADPKQLGSADALLMAVRGVASEEPVLLEQPAEDWLAAFRAASRPFAVGRSWWVDPCPARRTPPPAGRDSLVIEPRMAFGTGGHESTRLLLEELETVALDGRSVLDIGTGSSILALAVAMRGATVVVGCDIDAQAVFVARQIMADQDPGRLMAQPRLLAGGVAAIERRFDVVLCNMIPTNWAPFAPELPRLLTRGGVLLLSGLLHEHQPQVDELLRAQGLVVNGWRHLREWSCALAGWRS